MRKAITPVISIIVLLLITVALVGGGWLYISGYFETMMKVIDIPPGSAYCRGNEATVVIRNPGQSVINNSDHKAMLGLFHDDEDAVGAWRFEGDGNAVLDSSGNENTGSIYGDTVLLMHFDEVSGLGAYDETSYDNDGRRGGATWKTSGCVSGNCLEFDGTVEADYVLVDHPGSSLDFADEFTIMAWAKPDELDTQRFIMEKQGGFAGMASGYSLLQDDSPDRWRFIVHVEGASVSCDSDFAPTGRWQHIAGTRDVSGFLTLYVDGVAQADTEILSGAIVTSPNHLCIGADHVLHYGFTGSIDEVAIYNQALTEDEIKAHYNAGRAKFIEPGKPGRFGYGMEFDGDGDYVEVNDDPSLRFNQYDAFSISFWGKNKASGYVLSKMRSSGCTSGKFGYQIGGSTEYQFRIEKSCSGTTSVSTSTGGALLNTWHHLVMVYDNKDMKVYLDGKLNGSGTFAHDTGSTTPEKALTIGARSYDATVTSFFNGTIDEVVILNTALTPEQIADDLTPACSCSGNTCQCGDLIITRTAGEGYFHPYFSSSTIQPKGSVRMTDYNCMGDSCTYRITSPAASVEATVECR